MFRERESRFVAPVAEISREGKIRKGRIGLCAAYTPEIYPSRFFAIALKDTTVLDVMTLQFRDKASNTMPSEIKPEQIATLALADISITFAVETLQ